MEAFLVSAGIVALGEMGDKTQLLALLLAARFQKPWPIVLGILGATLLNHTCAGLAGVWLGDRLTGPAMRWVVGLSFLAVAAWACLPDRLESGRDARFAGRGAFLATLISFFLVEIGDKTQVATVALAARFGVLAPVVAGTTLGMLLADAPVVWLGDTAAARLPMRWIRLAAAASFALLGLGLLLGTCRGGPGHGPPA